MTELRFTILGSGSSGGVPRIGGIWGDCDPSNPKNRRSRCSMLIEREDAGGTTRVLIDTSPDMRNQLIDAGVGELDAVVYTHSHADHVHGLDDLRMVYFNTRKRIEVWADVPTQNDLISRFGYAFVQPEGSLYPPVCEMNTIDGDVVISGAGGSITLTPLKVAHGPIDALAFEIHGLVYMPDVSEMYEDTRQAVKGIDIWVLDALRRAPHKTHIHFQRALDWIAEAAPKRAVLTNMHVDLDYETVNAETPDHVTAGYDGMQIKIPL